MNYSPPKRRRLYLMRHGAVDYFGPDGLRVADPSQVDLNEAGIKQAQAAGQLLAAAGVRVDRVVTSTLPRTIQTAKLVLQASRHTGLSLHSVQDLRELESGDMQAVAPEQLEESFLGPFRGVPQADLSYLGGERIGNFTERVMQAALAELAKPDWEVMLMVAHGGVNRVLMGYGLLGQVTMLSNLLQAPACLNILDVAETPRDWVVRAVNLNPLNWLSPASRTTTVEQMLMQYLDGQNRHGESKIK